MTTQDVLNALRNVEDPDLRNDIVTLNMVKDIVIEGNKVRFTVVLTTPACPLKEIIKNACINAIHILVDKNAEVEVEMTARTPEKPVVDGRSVRGIKNIVAVGSGKGGVGKSTVSANLAVALSKLGAKVGLLDADIYGPSLPIMFGLWDERLYMKEQDGKDWFIPFDKFGVKLMSIGFMVQSNQPLVLRGPMTSKAIHQLIRDADWGELDYLIIDLPPGTGDIAITLATDYSITGAVIVTTPQKVAVADARKAAEMLVSPKINIPILGVIENMSYFTPLELPNNQYYIFGRGGGKTLADTLQVPYLGDIPIVEGLREAGDLGEPIVFNNEGKLSKIFTEVASNLVRQISIINVANRNVI